MPSASTGSSSVWSLSAGVDRARRGVSNSIQPPSPSDCGELSAPPVDSSLVIPDVASRPGTAADIAPVAGRTNRLPRAPCADCAALEAALAAADALADDDNPDANQAACSTVPTAGATLDGELPAEPLVAAIAGATLSSCIPGEPPGIEPAEY